MTRVGIVVMLLGSCTLFLRAAPAQQTAKIDRAATLQRDGKLAEARETFRQAAIEYRDRGEITSAASAFSQAAEIAVQLGDYGGAVEDASSAIELRKQSGDKTNLGNEFNTAGRAYQYLGNYPAALENYREALAADRASQNLDGEISRLSNIGNIHYFLGQYSTALQSYQEAGNLIAKQSSPDAAARERELVNANLAALYQRLGQEQKALEIYVNGYKGQELMDSMDLAQLLLNEGVLYRRLGDPIKAMELYTRAKGLFQKGQFIDGQIQTLRNIGIVNALDLNRLAAAQATFSEALVIAHRSGNKRGIVQVALYRGEVLRRMGKVTDARKDLQEALSNAESAGLAEEQWKALYSLGRSELVDGHTAAARNYFSRAIVVIESLRSTLKLPSLRSDFLADKRDVYDAMIELERKSQSSSAQQMFWWMERSRARTLQDRVAARTSVEVQSLPGIQAMLPDDAMLVDYWVGPEETAAVWATRTEAGVVECGKTRDIRELAAQLLTAVAEKNGDWRTPARGLGAKLLTGIPARRQLIVVPDGPLSLPFDILLLPASGELLIESTTVSYLPAAGLLRAPRRNSFLKWFAPWHRQLVAFGDPFGENNDALRGGDTWTPLTASADEIRGIAAALPGTSEIHMRGDATKGRLFRLRTPNPELIHFATHALVDTENPDRSRILMSAPDPAQADYLFQEELYDLHFDGVQLVTVSACDTARGKFVRGEGVEAFNQAFLAAGASATATSLWKVSDEPTAEFMKQFYYFLGQNHQRNEALREAKLRFLRSNSELAQPRYWAAFNLHGDGWNSGRPTLSWAQLLYATAAAVALLALILFLARRLFLLGRG